MLAMTGLRGRRGRTGLHLLWAGLFALGLSILTTGCQKEARHHGSGGSGSSASRGGPYDGAFYWLTDDGHSRGMVLRQYGNAVVGEVAFAGTDATKAAEFYPFTATVGPEGLTGSLMVTDGRLAVTGKLAERDISLSITWKEGDEPSIYVFRRDYHHSDLRFTSDLQGVYETTGSDALPLAVAALRDREWLLLYVFENGPAQPKVHTLIGKIDGMQVSGKQHLFGQQQESPFKADFAADALTLTIDPPGGTGRPMTLARVKTTPGGGPGGGAAAAP
ncbi:MAG: hypothetical protein BIFFINMI_03526 [Phycisphaerae bacterium]|nr:hypothetical protein [Phycisphaerae bacterium]